MGIAQLHPEQEQAIEDSLKGRDVLMVLPTGFGKSACYQIPSMILDKPVVVLSPLLALLRDQHEKLLARDIDCVRIDGTVRGRARRLALERIEAGGPVLVMTTPESLANAEIFAALEKSGVGLLAVDEAHCISEWGHDFRPAYRRIGRGIRKLGSPPILALTATATPQVRDTIVESLGMRDQSVIATSPHRDNLAFEVLPCEGDMRPRSLVRLAQRLRRPGIIYCATTREVDAVYGLLVRFKIPAHRYHGSMTPAERNAEQEKYMQPGRRAVMVATSAFGLGIDKPDIRYVLHFQAPASLEQYVQEAGRAGRDDRKANCILLHDPTDRAIHESLLSRSRVRPDQLFRVGHALGAWGQEGKVPTPSALALSAELGPRIAGALLATIEEAGLLTATKDGVHLTGDPNSIEEDVRRLAGQFETLRTQDGRRLDTMAAYAHVDGCRAAFLRSYFGEDVGGDCGLCDVCRGSRERPESFFKPLVAKKKKAPAKKKRRGRSGRGRSKKAAAKPAGEAGTGRRRRGGRGRGRRAKPQPQPEG